MDTADPDRGHGCDERSRAAERSVRERAQEAVDRNATAVVVVVELTKMLALNATVDAARAGDAGTGFSDTDRAALRATIGPAPTA